MNPVSDSYSEDTLVEQPAINLFAELGWETANCWGEKFGGDNSLSRETPSDVVLFHRLRDSLERLNPSLPSAATNQAIEEITKDHSVVSPARANQEVYRLLKNGIRVTVPSDEGGDTAEVVRVVDWNHPENNDFFLASQFWVAGEPYKRRADLVGFVNGLPLVFIELKASHRRLENAFRDNLRDYKKTIPQIFPYNAFIVLSNGSESKIGSMTASYEHFAEWKKISSEGERGRVSLETMIRGTCEKYRLLDIIENFTLFSEGVGGLAKLVAKNHQYLGVNNVLDALKDRGNDGKLGVFWHTQGSGKSYSMVFFSQKVLRKLPGDYTFLIVTDRQELDDQIYKTFSACGAVTEGQVQAESGEHLKRLLSENHRNIFSLIQKFRTEGGEKYPELSDRSDIIVMTDEAHRSQYDTFAMNMRSALPKASFVGFTGTPLMAGEEKTKEVFGDYVSIYNFHQSVEDGATVPLYYENRIPELQLTNEALNEDLDRIVDEAMLDERQEQRLQREFNREYQLLTREERLEKVAADLVSHFMGRGQRGKAMVVSIDKATAIRMYEKVQKYWLGYLENLREELASTYHEEDRIRLQEKISYMETTDMAVVISPSQNEAEDLARKGLDICPHRERIIREDLETKFKDSQDPFRIVFVCAMWMTGFDVPSVSTVYLDKPMRNHTLMQTIARANRVFKDKQNGLIVDYVGVFRDLEKALAVYGSGVGGEAGEEETPVRGKEELVANLVEAVEGTMAFLKGRGVDPRKILDSEGFDRLKLLDDARESVVENDEWKRMFLSLVSSVMKLYKAVLPDTVAGEFSPLVKLFSVMVERIRILDPEVDISEVMEGVSRVLDESITARSFVIPDNDDQEPVDLSRIDFEELKKRFEQGRKRTEAERLRGQVNSKLKQMVRLNKSRTDYLQRLQELIDEYNSGSMNINFYFEALVKMARELTKEEQRTISEGLNEEELAVFDLLTRPRISLTNQEKEEVKKISRGLLDNLKKEKLVLDWRKRQQARASVRVTIEKTLDELPEGFTDEIYWNKCDSVYQHIYDSYYGSGRSIYADAG